MGIGIHESNFLRKSFVAGAGQIDALRAREIKGAAPRDLPTLTHVADNSGMVWELPSSRETCSSIFFFLLLFFSVSSSVCF